MNTLEMKFDEIMLNSCIQEADIDGSGSLDFLEFLGMISDNPQIMLKTSM